MDWRWQWTQQWISTLTVILQCKFCKTQDSELPLMAMIRYDQRRFRNQDAWPPDKWRRTLDNQQLTKSKHSKLKFKCNIKTTQLIQFDNGWRQLTTIDNSPRDFSLDASFKATCLPEATFPFALGASSPQEQSQRCRQLSLTKPSNTTYYWHVFSCFRKSRKCINIVSQSAVTDSNFCNPCESPSQTTFQTKARSRKHINQIMPHPKLLIPGKETSPLPPPDWQAHDDHSLGPLVIPSIKWIVHQANLTFVLRYRFNTGAWQWQCVFGVNWFKVSTLSLVGKIITKSDGAHEHTCKAKRPSLPLLAWCW